MYVKLFDDFTVKLFIYWTGDVQLSVDWPVQIQLSDGWTVYVQLFNGCRTIFVNKNIISLSCSCYYILTDIQGTDNVIKNPAYGDKESLNQCG